MSQMRPMRGTLAAVEDALPAEISDEARDRLLTVFREARVEWYRFGREDEREGRPEPW